MFLWGFKNREQAKESTGQKKPEGKKEATRGGPALYIINHDQDPRMQKLISEDVAWLIEFPSVPKGSSTEQTEKGHPVKA